MKTTRKNFLVTSAFGTAGLALSGTTGLLSLSGCDSMSIRQLNEMRKKTQGRKRRIIMNNDGNDVIAASKITPFSSENLLKQRTLGLLEGSQVDTIFYCTGVFNLYFHQSEESEIHTRRDPVMKEYLDHLKMQETDPIKLMTDFGHNNDKEIFWSMRMNDTHDSSKNSDYLFCQWKRDHPEFLVGKYEDKFPYGANRWSSVNYDIPEVREKVYRILYDVCSRYDIDGIELDFFRHPVLFKQQMTGEPITGEQCDKMTGLMQRIREMTDHLGVERKRPFLIAIRIPDSVGYCRAMGIDLISWLEKDLVDIITGADYFKLEPWENLVSLGQKYEIPVYACFEGRRIERTFGHPPDADESLPVWRGEAFNAWKAGINGIYTFNRSNPYDKLFREIGDPELLAQLERIDQTVYVNENSWSRPEVWLKDGDKYVSEEIRKF